MNKPDPNPIVFLIVSLLVTAILAGMLLVKTEREADTCKPQLERILK